MNRTFGWLVPLLLWGLASTALALDVPALKGRVNDRAHLLSASAAARIEDKLQKLEEDKGAQVVVLTVDSLGGGPLEEYSLRVAETWKLGRAGQDDGALLLIAKNDRSMRLEVGYGLEPVLTDVMTKRILDQILRPSFRAGDFDGGVERAIDAIDGLNPWNQHTSATDRVEHPERPATSDVRSALAPVSGAVRARGARHQSLPVVLVPLLGALRVRGRPHRHGAKRRARLRSHLARRSSDYLVVFRTTKKETTSGEATREPWLVERCVVVWRGVVLRRRRIFGRWRQLRRRRFFEQLVSRSGVAFQPAVPVHPVRPRFGDRAGGIDAKGHDGQPLGLSRRPEQPQAGLLGRPVALLFVAVVASHYDVFPIGLAALRFRNDVVVREPAQTMPQAAILALEVIAHGHVDSRELDGALAAHDRAKQPNHGRHLDGDADRPNVFVVFLDDFDLAIENHANGALPADDPMGLITLVQN